MSRNAEALDSVSHWKFKNVAYNTTISISGCMNRHMNSSYFNLYELAHYLQIVLMMLRFEVAVTPLNQEPELQYGMR